MTPQLLATVALLAWGLVPVGPASGTRARVREAFRNDLPSRADYDRMERGYYEQILDAGRAPGAAAGTTAGQAGAAGVDHGRLTTKVGDVREYVLKPGLTHDPGRRIPWSTNAHGMRDRAYPVARPAATFRVALVGDSIAAGWGVGDGDGFEPRLERALDARSRAGGGPAVEVLNFAVPGHGPGQRWTHFDAAGWAFGPDLVVFESTPADVGWDERRLRALLARGVGLDAPVYRDVLAGAGIKAGLDPEDYRRALKPLRGAILAGVYRAAAAECRSRGVPSVWVLIPRVGKPVDPAERARLVATARGAGFTAVVDACDAYDGAEAADLAVGPHDFHPNAEGHARISRTLAGALAARPELGVPGSGPFDGADRPAEGAEPR